MKKDTPNSNVDSGKTNESKPTTSSGPIAGQNSSNASSEVKPVSATDSSSSPVAPTPPKMSASEEEDTDVAVETEHSSPLEPLLLNQLKDMYYAERKMAEMMSELMRACSSEELEETIFNHQKETERQVKRMEKIFKMIGKEPEEKRCEAIEGLMKEAKELRDLTEPGSAVRDAAIILSMQKIEHYEIATYSGLLEIALTMNLHSIAPLLDKSLKEEEDADEELTRVAEEHIQINSR